MKKKVYWIRVEQLQEVYKCMTQDDASIICQEHYQLIDMLPHSCSLTSKKPIVYWIENRDARMSTYLNKIADFEYKQLSIGSFFIDTHYENRLQKQKADVVRGDDTEGNRVQSRKCKATVTVGHLSYKAVKV
jgi:hypothetical protein